MLVLIYKNNLDHLLNIQFYNTETEHNSQLNKKQK